MISLLLLSFFAIGEIHINGLVRDSISATPLVGASVHIVGTMRGVYSDHHGEFHLHPTDSSDFTIEVSIAGYKKRVITLTAPFSKMVVVNMEGLRSKTVVVTTERVHNAGTTTQMQANLSSVELRENGGQSFATALMGVPGVTTVQTGPTVQKPMIRGQYGNRIVINSNGVNQEGQQWGSEHAPEIDPLTPMQIQVLKGASGVVYGPNAMGGIIRTEPIPLDVYAPVSGQAVLSLFSNNLQGAAGGYVQGGGILGEPLAMRFYLNGRKAGDSRTPDYVLGNTAFQDWSTGLYATVGDNSLGGWLSVTHFATELGVFSGSHIGNATDMQRAIERGSPGTVQPFGYDISNPKQQVQHTMVSAQFHTYLDNIGTLRFVGGWQRNNRSEYDAHNSRIVGRGTDPAERAADSIARLGKALVTPAMNLLLSTYSLDAVLDHRLSDVSSGSVGLNLIRQNNSRGGSVSLIPDYVLYGVGGHVLENTLIGNIQLAAGLRYDVRWLNAVLQKGVSGIPQQRNTVYSSISGSLGAQTQLTEHLALAANIGSAWRPPQVNELYSDGLHHGSATYEIGDSSLTAERNIAMDLNCILNVGIFKFDLGGYATRYFDYIYAKPLPDQPTSTIRGTFPTYKFTSTDAWINGLDFDVNAQISELLSITARGSVVRGTSTDGVPLPLIPSDRLRIGLHVHSHDVGFANDIFADLGVAGVRMQDQYVEGSDYVPPPPGYVLVDAKLGVNFDVVGQGMTFGISITNLLDTTYRDYLNRFRYFADDVGRNVMLTFTLPFN